MNTSKQSERYNELNRWCTSPHGLKVTQACADELAGFSLPLRGERLLQIGLCGKNPWLPELNFSKKTIVSPCLLQKRSSVKALVNQLPFARDSVDCILAPFLFEACSYEKSPLDELDRILKPMGHIVFWGVNPISMWGLALHLKWYNLFGSDKIKLHSCLATKKAVIERGYRQCALSTFYYIPSVSSEKSIHYLEFLNEMGKMIWLFPANFYCLVVQKYQVISPSYTLDVIGDNYLGCVDNSVA